MQLDNLFKFSFKIFQTTVLFNYYASRTNKTCFTFEIFSANQQITAIINIVPFTHRMIPQMITKKLSCCLSSLPVFQRKTFLYNLQGGVLERATLSVVYTQNHACYSKTLSKKQFTIFSNHVMDLLKWFNITHCTYGSFIAYLKVDISLSIRN